MQQSFDATLDKQQEHAGKDRTDILGKTGPICLQVHGGGGGT